MAKQLILTLLGSIVAGLGAAAGCAITLAVIDIYLAGHGRATLGRPWIDGAFVHLSRADVVLCIFSLGTALIAGWTVRRALQGGGKDS